MNRIKKSILRAYLALTASQVAVSTTYCIRSAAAVYNNTLRFTNIIQIVVIICPFVADVHNLFINTPLSNFALHGILRMIFYAIGKHCPMAE